MRGRAGGRRAGWLGGDRTGAGCRSRGRLSGAATFRGDGSSGCAGLDGSTAATGSRASRRWRAGLDWRHGDRVAGRRALGDDDLGHGWYMLVNDRMMRGDVRTGSVRGLAGLLDAGSDISDQLGLLAVAGKVGQGRAAVASQGRDKAVELNL